MARVGGGQEGGGGGCLSVCFLSSCPDSGPGWGPYGMGPGTHQDLSGPRTGMPVMPQGRPYKPRMGPSRDLKGHPFDLAMGKPWAIPYRARTGFKRGCPCPDWPRCAQAWCPVPIRYGIRPGTLSGCDATVGLFVEVLFVYVLVVALCMFLYVTSVEPERETRGGGGGKFYCARFPRMRQPPNHKL